MITILIADDEKLERNGIKFLLREKDVCILEASNGKEACAILQKQPVDMLFSDIKMPYMNGLELAREARGLQPEIEIILFSGYNDFSYAKEALHYGVLDYVLKPVDPAEFHKVYETVKEKVEKKKKEKKQSSKEKEYGLKYELSQFLYYGVSNKDKIVQFETDCYGKMVLIATEDDMFQRDEELFIHQLKNYLSVDVFYMNLTENEALLLFKESYLDSKVLGEKIYHYFKNKYNVDCYLAMSNRIDSWESMPEVFWKLEELLAQQFYQPTCHIFYDGMEERTIQEEEIDEQELIKQIGEDIKNRDVLHLQKQFSSLTAKYKAKPQVSQIYIKFVFSNIIKAIYDEIKKDDLKELADKVDLLYRCKRLQEVIDVTKEAITELEKYVQEKRQGFREEIAMIKSYIYHHYAENLTIEELASKVYLSPGYASALFKEETGVNLNRFIREVRMKKAKELLETTNKKISQVAVSVGFSNQSYFCRSFREYFGCTPESLKKGKVEDDEATLSN